MSLTKKDFIRIAEILKGNIDKAENGFVWKWNNPEELIKSLSIYFKSENPKFNEQKFKQAVFEN